MPGRNGDLLLLRTEITHRIRVNVSPCLELPNGFSGGRVQGEKFSLSRAAEYQSSSRGHHSRPRRSLQFELPLHLAGLWLQRADCAPSFLVRHDAKSPRVKQGAGLVIRFPFEVKATLLLDRDIEEIMLRTIRRAVPVRGSGHRRIHH